MCSALEPSGRPKAHDAVGKCEYCHCQHCCESTADCARVVVQLGTAPGEGEMGSIHIQISSLLFQQSLQPQPKVKTEVPLVAAQTTSSLPSTLEAVPAFYNGTCQVPRRAEPTIALAMCNIISRDKPYGRAPSQPQQWTTSP